MLAQLVIATDESVMNNGTAHTAVPVSERVDGATRLRNRRLGLILTIVFVALVALCAYYIARFGGTNKPPMKPFHSTLSIVDVRHPA